MLSRSPSGVSRPPGQRSLRNPNDGFSLLETLVVLAVLTLLVAGALPLLRETPSKLVLERRIAEIQQTAGLLRHEAAKEQHMAGMDVTNVSCTATQTQIRFYPDGTAQGPDLCLTHGGLSQTLRLDHVTGRLK